MGFVAGAGSCYHTSKQCCRCCQAKTEQGPKRTVTMGLTRSPFRSWGGLRSVLHLRDANFASCAVRSADSVAKDILCKALVSLPAARQSWQPSAALASCKALPQVGLSGLHSKGHAATHLGLHRHSCFYLKSKPFSVRAMRVRRKKL